MHPDLFLRVYRQQERELEQRLRHRLVAQERREAGSPGPATARPAPPAMARRVAQWFDGASGRLRPEVLGEPCCATA